MAEAVRVVLLHGLGADHRAFQRFQRLLPDEWETHALDLLGHGDAPKPERGYSMEHHADYIAGRIAEMLQLPAVDAVPADFGQDPVVVVGHSYGAGTGVALAARHPHLVRALVLLDPVAYTRLDLERGMRDRTEQMIRGKQEGRVAETVERLFPNDSPAIKRWTIETWERMSVGVVNEIDHEWMRFASDVQRPVWLIHGDREKGGGGPMPGEFFSDARLTRIEGAGHYLHATHARQTAAAVVDAVNEALAATA